VIYEQVADDGVIFLWHFSKVSINDLFSLIFCVFRYYDILENECNRSFVNLRICLQANKIRALFFEVSPHTQKHTYKRWPITTIIPLSPVIA
jgi:hypothetical protein